MLVPTAHNHLACALWRQRRPPTSAIHSTPWPLQDVSRIASALRTGIRSSCTFLNGSMESVFNHQLAVCPLASPKKRARKCDRGQKHPLRGLFSGPSVRSQHPNSTVPKQREEGKKRPQEHRQPKGHRPSHDQHDEQTPTTRARVPPMERVRPVAGPAARICPRVARRG